MEQTGGEPDVIGKVSNSGEVIFIDCSPESPKGRPSLCYDRDALEARKNNKPDSNVEDMASTMGIELLTEEEYHHLQEYGPFDAKTSSWLETPADVRERGGALFGDYRFGHAFIYHNGPQSYYVARGSRGKIIVELQ